MSEQTYERHCAQYLDSIPEKCIITSFGDKYREGWEHMKDGCKNDALNKEYEDGEHELETKFITVKNGRVTKVIYKERSTSKSPS